MNEQEQGPRDEEDSEAEKGDHLASPEPGYPVGDTQPPDGLPDRPHEHPEEIGETTPDQQSSPGRQND